MRIFLFILFIMTSLPLCASDNPTFDYQVDVDELTVYAEPSTRAKVVTTLQRDTYITNCPTYKEEWLCLSLPDKGEGWVKTSSLRSISHIPTPQEIHEKAVKKAKAIHNVKANEVRDIFPLMMAIIVITFFVCIILYSITDWYPFGFISLLALLAFPLAVIYYMASCEGYALWFCYPSKMGWALAVLFYIIVLAVAFVATTQCFGGLLSLFDTDTSVLLRLAKLIWSLIWCTVLYYIVMGILTELMESIIFLLFVITGGGASSSKVDTDEGDYVNKVVRGKGWTQLYNEGGGMYRDVNTGRRYKGIGNIADPWD